MAHSLAGSEIIPRCSAAVVHAQNSQCAPMTARPPSSRLPRGVCLWPLVAAPPPRLGGAIYRRLRSFSTHASLCSHSWSFRQAGHRNGIVTPDSDSNLIASVVSLVGDGYFEYRATDHNFRHRDSRTIGASAKRKRPPSEAASSWFLERTLMLASFSRRHFPEGRH